MANTLAFTNVSVQATNSVTVVDPIDLSTGSFGTTFGSLNLQAPTFSLNDNMNMSTISAIGLPTVGTVNLTGKITTGTVLFRASKFLSTSTVTHVNVLADTASIQQAVDLSSTTAGVTVAITTGHYNEAVSVGRSMTFTTSAAGGHVNNGTLLLTSSSATLTLTGTSFTNASGATLGGVGTYDMSGVTAGLLNHGTVAPGSSPGLLAIDGTYTQANDGDLKIEIGGTTVGSQYDRLAISGVATLGGFIDVSLVNGFTPSSSDTFTILTSLARAGVFSNALTTVPADGGVFDVTYGPTSVMLSNFRFVPEPGGWMILLVPVVSVLTHRRRRFDAAH
jgi:hypothetical protein